MKNKIEFISSVVLVFIAALSRLLEHPLNFTPLGAIALFGGIYFTKKISFLIPIAALLISDYFLGFYSGMIWVYSAFILMAFIGNRFKNNVSKKNLFGITIINSFIFFIITNFGVWITGSMYTQNINGLIECFVAAIPFYRNSIAGDLFYVVSIFGLFELSKIFIKQDSLVIEKI